MKYRYDDPDETEGRRMYRAMAEALARMQISLARRKVRLRIAREALRTSNSGEADRG